MPWSELADHALALAVYPGALASFLLGGLAEAAAAWALVPSRGGPLGGAATVGTTVAGLLRRGRVPVLAGTAGFLALLAAIQVSLPFNPVPLQDRNLLTAAFALVACGWLTWAWGWNRRAFDPRLMLLVQAAWLVALLAPAIEVQSLRPQALGAVVLPGLLPVKVIAALLYVLCLPALLQLLPEAAPQGVPGTSRRRRDLEEAGFALVRILLWLSVCGLFASLFFPPSADDLLGVLRFLLLAGAAAALAIGLAANLIHRGSVFTKRRYGTLITTLLVGTLAVALITAFVEQPPA